MEVSGSVVVYDTCSHTDPTYMLDETQLSNPSRLKEFVPYDAITESLGPVLEKIKSDFSKNDLNLDLKRKPKRKPKNRTEQVAVALYFNPSQIIDLYNKDISKNIVFNIEDIKFNIENIKRKLIEEKLKSQAELDDDNDKSLAKGKAGGTNLKNRYSSSISGAAQTFSQSRHKTSKGELRAFNEYCARYFGTKEGLCFLCKKAKATTIDHLWPAVNRQKHQYGRSDPINSRPTCHDCNEWKNNTPPDDPDFQKKLISEGWWTPQQIDALRSYLKDNKTKFIFNDLEVSQFEPQMEEIPLIHESMDKSVRDPNSPPLLLGLAKEAAKKIPFDEWVKLHPCYKSDDA